MTDVVSNTQYANIVLDALAAIPITVPKLDIDEKGKQNAATFMTAFLCARLDSQHRGLVNDKFTTVDWNGGRINIRNLTRNFFWTKEGRNNNLSKFIVLV